MTDTSAPPFEPASSASKPGWREALRVLGLSGEPMSPAVQAALEALAGEVASQRTEIALLRAEIAALETAADTDPLTRLYNRRAFTRELRRAIAFAQRYHGRLCLAYLDLDGFKAVNDTFGHEAGDRLLRAAAGLLVDGVRTSDVVGRLGGDEFAVILPETDLDAARIKAGQLARALAAARAAVNPAVRAGPQAQAALAGFGVSIGVAALERSDTVETLLARADEDMFRTKRAKLKPARG
jgi:diguanylate cyclase (GGDEF)-like protein